MGEPITVIRTPIRLEYEVPAGRQMSRFLTQLVEGRIIGRYSPIGRVFVPPRGACPVTGELMGDEVQVADVGTVTTFCIVNIPFEGQRVKPPYAVAAIILDGADLPIFHLIAGCPVTDVHMGLRVRAVWAPPEERTPSLTSILHFEPSGEPDAPYDSYKEHL